MTQQRMTTLISKSPLLPSSVKKNLEKAEIEIRQRLQERGIQLSAVDFAALLEGLSPKGSNALLSYALDLIRPFSSGMGLRVSRLSDTQIEMVLPFRTRNKSENGELHDGACTSAAIEAAKTLWNRHSPLGNMTVDVVEIKYKKHRPIQNSCRVRMELSESVREKALAQLRAQRLTESENLLSLFDEKDQKVAEVTLKLELKWTPALNSTKE